MGNGFIGKIKDWMTDEVEDEFMDEEIEEIEEEVEISEDLSNAAVSGFFFSAETESFHGGWAYIPLISVRI